MKKITIIANWKMQHSLRESIALAEAIETGIPDLPEWLSVILCPTFTALPSVQPLLKQCQLGAQDVFWEPRGAYTGEIAPGMLAELGCHAVLIGHSERRQYLGETDAMVADKVRAAGDAGLMPIVCVGETAAERDRGQKERVAREQVIAACRTLSNAPSELVFAYEPVWAIGSGKTCTPEDANHMHTVIHDALRETIMAQTLDQSVRIVYGGSIDRNNVQGFLNKSHISGCLVGTASRRASDFLAVIDAVFTL